METLPTNPMTMPGMPLTGFSQSYGAKTSRGSRLGRSIPMSAGTEYYGYPGGGGGGGGGGATINFSPTISNIDAPLIESLDTGSTTKVTTGRPRRTGGGGGGGAATGGGRTPTGGGGGGGGRPARETAAETARVRLGRAENRTGLAGLAESGGKITVSELKGQLASGAGLRQTRNLIESGGLTLGGKATAFLNEQLGAKNARTLATGEETAGTQSGRDPFRNVVAARPPETGTLSSFSYPLNAPVVSGTNPRDIVTNAAALRTGQTKLTKSEAKTALNSGLTAQKVLKQIEKGNVTATKKATAKLKAAARIASA